MCGCGCAQVVLGGGQEAIEVTTTTTKAGKFDARFYHLVYEEEIGRVKGHFGPINSLKFHPDGKRWALIGITVSSFQRLQEWYLGWEKVSCLERCPQFRSRESVYFLFQFQLQQWRGGWLRESTHIRLQLLRIRILTVIPSRTTFEFEFLMFIIDGVLVYN